MNSVEILSPGIMSTIQDMGRFGFQGSGFSVSGCMDVRAFHDANVLVNNPLTAAVIEMQLIGICLKFNCRDFFALTGADMGAKLNNKPVSTYKTYEVKAGDILEMGMAREGRFGYLAVSGGFEVPTVMGSRSTNLKCKIGGFEGRALAEGDIIPVREFSGFFPNLYLKDTTGPNFSKTITLRVIKGPQDHFFTKNGIETFLTETYQVGDESDRMGYRLDGAQIESKGTVDILSDGIVFGSIQVPANGKPMILMADRQTTGGYAKIGTVISADLPKLSQGMPGCEVKFDLITIEESMKINKKEDRDRRRFRRKTGYSLIREK